MAVWLVTLIAPNGNSVTRPIVASFDWTAVAIMRARYDIAENDPTVTIEIRKAYDPDGSYEADLLKGQQREGEDVLNGRNGSRH